MKRAGLLVATFVASLVPWTAWGQCTVPGPVSFTTAAVTNIPDAPGCPLNGTVVTSTINVSGMATYLADVDALTNLVHPCTGEVQMMLTSPSGRTVTLFSNQPPAGCEANEFNGTTWDDDADPSGQLLYTFDDNLVTDRNYAGVGTAAGARLVPEEAMGAFIGENPNGTWTLSMVDQCNVSAGGTLNGWGLSVRAMNPPTITTQSFPGTGGAIPDGGSASFAVAVSAGLFVVDADLTTNLESPSSADIQMTLKSPQNTFVSLTTQSGAGANNFNGTIWDDQANFGGAAGHAQFGGNNGVTTDHAYAPNNTASTLVPEEAMGAFFGEDPTGNWQLTVADRAVNLGPNNLSAWNLTLKTLSCPTPTPTSSPTATGSPTVTPTGTITPQPTKTPGPATPTPTPTIPYVVCNGLPATMVGTTGSDLLIGSDFDDVIHALPGDDVVKGRLGNDIICGGAGNDVLRGNQGDDLIKGGGGNDALFGGKDRDVLIGGKGDDALDGADDDDTCIDNKGSNNFANCEN